MDYKVTIDNFDGPLDLLLHLIKQSNIDIFEIKIEDIALQYLNYIKSMEELNLNIASEYLIMAAELIEIKSNVLLPSNKVLDDEYEEDPREKLISKLLEYKKYKEVSNIFKNLEELRKTIYTKEPSDISLYQEDKNNLETEFTKDDLIAAFSKFLEKKELDKPLNTKITTKEYSVRERSVEILRLVTKNKKVSFDELFENFSKQYIVVTFLSILELAKKQLVEIDQENNFSNIFLVKKGSV